MDNDHYAPRHPLSSPARYFTSLTELGAALSALPVMRRMKGPKPYNFPTLATESLRFLTTTAAGRPHPGSLAGLGWAVTLWECLVHNHETFFAMAALRQAQGERVRSVRGEPVEP